jgi:hypothetical protein
MFWLAWTLMALGYTLSGLHKFDSPSWMDGSALTHVLNSPLSRNNFIKTFLLNLPPVFLRIASYTSLALETSFLPLGLFYHTRFYYWFAYLFFHIGILLTVNFADLTMGVFMIHVLTFDIRWLGQTNIQKIFYLISKNKAEWLFGLPSLMPPVQKSLKTL